MTQRIETQPEVGKKKISLPWLIFLSLIVALFSFAFGAGISWSSLATKTYVDEKDGALKAYVDQRDGELRKESLSSDGEQNRKIDEQYKQIMLILLDIQKQMAKK